MTAHQPRAADWEARCRASFARQAVNATLGLTIERLAPGECDLRLPFRAELTQQHGYLQAGVVAIVADNAGGYAALSLMAPGSDVVAVEFKINLMAPAKGEALVARGRVLRSGRTLTVTAVEVFAVEGGRESLCAVMQQTCMAVADQA